MLYPAVEINAKPVEMASISDGTSHTILVSEGAGQMEINNGYWACGLNCFTHDERGVNAPDHPSDEIVSDHPGGANAAFCDGSVRFLGQDIEAPVIAALCTRNGYETYDFDF